MKSIFIVIISMVLSFSGAMAFAEGSTHHGQGKIGQHDHSIKGAEVHDVEVTGKGFVPSRIKVKAGEKVVLRVKRTVKTTCAKKITVPSKGIVKNLPLNKSVLVEFTPDKRGEIAFGCAMDQMLSGVIVVN